MIQFQQSQALTSHFESFWSIVGRRTFRIQLKLGLESLPTHKV